MDRHKDTKRAELTDEICGTITDCLYKIMEREESAGVPYRNVVVPLLDALEHHVATAIAAVDDREVRDRLISCFNRNLPMRVAVYNAALASAATVQ